MRIASGLVVAGVVALIAVLMMAPRTETSGGASSDDPLVPAAADGPALSPSRRSAATRRDKSPLAGRYALTYRMTMSAPTARGQASGEMSIAAELEIAAGPKAGWLVGRLVQPLVKADPRLAGQMGTSASQPGAGFDAAFALQFDEDGAITELRHGAKAPSGARSLLSGLLRGLQVVRTEDDVGSKRWQLVEPGPDGDRDVTFVLDGAKLTKTWRVSELGSVEGARAPMNADGTVRMVFARGFMAHATYDLNVDADLSMGAGKARYVGGVRASLKRIGVASADWAASVDLDMLERGLGAKRIQAPRPKIVVTKGATVASLVQAASSAASQRNSRVRRSAMQQIATLIQQNPARAAVVAELVRHPKPGIERRTLVEALASSNTAAAKAEMSSLIDDPEVDPEARADVATVTTFMTHPGPKILKSLEQQLSGAGRSRLGTASLWALAGQARMQADRNADLSAKLSAMLLTRANATLGPAAAPLLKEDDTAVTDKKPAFGAFRSRAMAAGAKTLEPVSTGTKPGMGGLGEDDPTVGPGGSGKKAPALSDDATRGQVDAWLDALGTIGGEQVLPLIKPFLHHPYHQIRMTAVFALRFVHTSAGRIEIVNRMALDSDGWVRRSAVMAARYQPMGPFLQPVQRALREDIHPNVRLAAAYNLAVWAHKAPTLMAHVRKAADREPKALVARAMRDLEPMLLRDAPDGTVTMEPVLPGGKHAPSVPGGVVLVDRKVPKTAATAEGALNQGGQSAGDAP
ncbi:MAG: hypothetical protein KC502_11475 [Myxococcales bacterium]|nr:hypothetical protein [Myxococcales bacterium]